MSKEKINDNIIYILYDNESKEADIKLDDNKKRYIKSFKYLDITIVEIKEEDNIPKDCFLFPELKEKINNKLINSNIYIPQYPKGKELKNARGIIKSINKYEFIHLANTDYGSSGSPIFLENENRVIGIHKGGKRDNTENYADFIYPAINIVKKEIKERRNKGKYINGKYIDENGYYYEGELKNNIPNGKGINYYSNGNIQYVGDFVNGLFEGKGKYIEEEGNYYIGQFKNGSWYNKGTFYYSNGNILYKGDFIDSKFEGNGKYFWENGYSYIGQWKNGLRNGKGKVYYSNGNIKYEGDYVNDKREGYGKYIAENGVYYIGQWKNGLRNGKGTLYFSNGNIKHKGNWINDEFIPE